MAPYDSKKYNVQNQKFEVTCYDYRKYNVYNLDILNIDTL